MSRLGRTLGFLVAILILPAAAAAQFPPVPRRSRAAPQSSSVRSSTRLLAKG